MKRDVNGKFVSNWDSETKKRVSVSLTSTAWRSLDEEAQKRGISRSEVIEQVARSLGNESCFDAEKTLLQAQIIEQQQEIATLQRQKQELSALLENAPDAIARSERQVTMILESITDAFVAFDRNWHYTYVNQAAAAILHKTPEELIGKHVWNEVFPELVGGVAYQELHRAMAEQVSVAWEEFGEPVQLWLEIHAYPSAEGVAVYFRDITKRKQAEIALRQQTEALENQHKWLEAVLDLMPTPTVFIEPGTAEVTFSNRIANELAGGDLLKNKSVEDYYDTYYCTDVNGDRLPPENMPAVLIARGERLENYELNWHTPGGIRSTLCWGETLPAMYGHPAIGICMFQDVTRLKQIEENLRQAEERLQLALSSAQMVAWDIDLITNNVVFFPNALLVWGVKLGTAEDFIAVIHPDDQQRVMQAAQEAIAGEQSYYMQEYRVIGPDGIVRWLNSQGRVYLDETGRGVRMIGVSVDITERKQIEAERSRAEEALRESEARLQLALKVGRMGTWNWDMQTGKILWSENHFTILGLQVNEGEPSYKLWADQVHPDDLATAKARIKEAIAQKKEYHHEYRLLWSDGSIHWVEVRGHFIYDSQGNPQHSIGAVIDITDRKQAEQEREQLLERERIARTQAEAAQRQLTTIVETSPVGIALLDGEQRFIAINEALAEINGLTREQHLGHSIPELFGQSDPQLVAVFDDIYTTGNAFISASFAVKVPGRSERSSGYYNVYYLPTINSNHQVEGVLAYVLDVTERVRLEHGQRFLSEASAVLTSSLDYQTTLERVAQLIIPELADWCTVHIVEEDGSIEQITVAHADPGKLQWAQEISRKYPLDPDAIRGAALTLRTGESDILPDIPDELLVQTARDPEHLEILRQVGFKSVMTVPLRTQARILGVISFVSAESGRRYDLTDLQLAEELARRASLAIDNAQLYMLAQRDRAKAESANRVKDEFLAVLSHELRSPLNPILGWTKMLRSKRLDATKTDQALETIERNVKLQAQLIEDLLDVSRILQGKMTLNVAPVNLAATITAALETVRLAADAKSIQIQTNLNPLSGTISGDMNRLQQVVWNLLSNAVKFTPSGGRVEIQLKQVGMYAQIQVKDTGKGIKPEFLPHVFEYFQQEDGTTTRQFGGLGLGLAIVRHFTELHGGTVEANSPGLNLGATFTVRLPLNFAEQELLCDDGDLETVTHLTGIRILVVDDDADIRELSAFILTQAGAEVTTAASAVQALILLNQSIPDLLLCDIGMPEMDGYSLIRQIRKWSHKQGGTIPAIALTAYAGEINQQQALAAGFQMHIPKPVEPETLMQAIVQLLRPVEHRA